MDRFDFRNDICIVIFGLFICILLVAARVFAPETPHEKIITSSYQYQHSDAFITDVESATSQDESPPEYRSLHD